MSWWEYVQAVTNGANGAEIAKRVGISQPSVSAWKHAEPRPETAVRFARAYGRPVIEVFVAAGWVTPEEAGVKAEGRPSLASLSNQDLMRTNQELMREMERRMNDPKPVLPVQDKHHKRKHDGHHNKATYKVFPGMDH